MKLYKLMLKGSKMGPQVFGTWSDGGNGTCAMGAIMLGCGLMQYNEWYQSLSVVRSQFPELSVPTTCPVEGCFRAHHGMNLMNVIMHLNDFHTWSRQRIAEWLCGSKITAPKGTKKVAVGA